MLHPYQMYKMGSLGIDCGFDIYPSEKQNKESEANVGTAEIDS